MAGCHRERKKMGAPLAGLAKEDTSVGTYLRYACYVRPLFVHTIHDKDEQYTPRSSTNTTKDLF